MTLADAVVDCAFYEEGCRQDGRLDVEDALREVEGRADGFVWIGLHDAAPSVVEGLGERFGLPPLAVEDAVHAHQRPKLEVFGEVLFMVSRPRGTSTRTSSCRSASSCSSWAPAT